MEIQPQLPLVGETHHGIRARVAVDDDWRIDEPTRVAGRQGLAAARAALARTAPVPEDRRADAA